MSGKHTLKIDVPAGGTRKTPPHPSWTISPLSLSLSLSLVRASTFGKRTSTGLLVLVKTFGDAGTCFDLPEEGLFALEESREKTDGRKERPREANTLLEAVKGRTESGG